MSERDLQRIEVLSKVVDGRMTLVAAAHVLGLSTRQVHRLLDRIQTTGAASIRHKAIGRPSNNRISSGVRDYAVTFVRECYADFGPTLACEMLAERDGLRVSRETLRKWMSSAGIWLSRKQRRTFHQPRLRRQAYGELVQIDGSEHPWFEDRGDPCSLLVFIDDATGKLMQLRFVRSESAFSYFEALELYLKDHGAPIAFYSDKHSVFRVAKKDAKGGQGITQFGRALCELNIEILCANSSQAKGRGGEPRACDSPWPALRDPGSPHSPRCGTLPKSIGQDHTDATERRHPDRVSVRARWLSPRPIAVRRSGEKAFPEPCR